MNRSFQPSPNVTHVTPSMTSGMAARARALRATGRTVVDLSQGQPEFDTPAFIREAAQRAIDEGATRYTATDGILPLREAMAQQANRRHQGLDEVGADEVVVTSGAKQALFNACFVLFGPGDEVLVPTPNWTSYYEIVELARAVPVPVLGDPAQQWKVDPDALRAASTPRTRGILLNSPCNPTGAVYSPGEIAAIAALARERGWWLLSDEVYRRIAYEAPASSVLDCTSDRERVVVIDAVSKSFAMTGWRLGWAVGPREVVKAMAAMQSHTTSNAAAVSQHAALAALQGGAAADGAVAEMVEALRQRRDAALQELLRHGPVEHVRPDGAFYLYVRVGSTGGVDPGAFAYDLLEREGVAVVPGAAFRTPEWIRISYGGAEADVRQGVRTIADTLHAARTAG
ncbi:aminotransferase class I/II-fold pyridoxal phosphate-dependent enzyme [Longimicrobium terrae]|uniref:Aspartate aminotransferase n=1 Tax=Longimicrobium terrae TaxID=1639882 RepID=A0A841H031_9BACT|nr:aspartate aminotransferase [Longimicrobium terrae]MBB6071421.1 aspartate aminotransferase [Longimicrobium terrae]NNC31358.1 pyridoxal phosphate-dependent aminotransferase [Longimicrobium terrae]